MALCCWDAHCPEHLPCPLPRPSLAFHPLPARCLRTLRSLRHQTPPLRWPRCAPAPAPRPNTASPPIPAAAVFSLLSADRGDGPCLPPAPDSGPLSSALSPEASGCTPQRTPSAWTWVTDALSPGSPCTALRFPRPGCRSLPLLVPRSLLCSLSASTRSCSRASTRPCVDGSQHALSAQGSPNLTGHVMCHTGSPPLPGSFLSSGFLVPPPSRPGVTSSEPGPSPS